MFCSSCGSEIGRGLNYCNSCGARTVDENSDLRRTVARNFSISVGIIGTFGLISFVILIKELIASGFSSGLLFAVAFLYMAAFVSICYFMMSNILKTVRGSDSGISHELVKPQLKTPDTKKLNEHQEPAQSVVDNTTRTLDETLIEREEVPR